MSAQSFRNQKRSWADKIDRDSQLTDLSRKSFYDHLDGCPDGVSVVDRAVDYFRLHKFEGDVLALPDFERLGSLKKRRELVNGLAKAAGVLPQVVEEVVSEAMTTGKVEELRSDYGMVLIHPRSIWAFRNPESPADPFDGHDLADLPCRLGLNATVEDEYIALRFTPQPNTVHLATAFDGSTNLDRWEPGGETLPGSECRKRYGSKGLPEVVVKPTPYSNVVDPLTGGRYAPFDTRDWTGE